MSKLHKDDLNELLKAGIIDNATAANIAAYYQAKAGDNSNRLLLVFGILGSVLVGLGVILIIAHNWDNFSRTTKAIFAFLPLIIGQALCFYTLIKQKENQVWSEGSAVFLFFAIGSCIAMISQIYNLPGDMGSYLFTWMILAFPIIYLMRSAATSLLFFAGITWYACQVGYWSGNDQMPFLYLLLFLLALPFYLQLIIKKPFSNFTIFHHWLVPLSVIITLGTWSNAAEEIMFIAYMSLLSLVYLIGRYFIKWNHEFFNSYQIISSAGILILLMVFSFQENWRDILRLEITFDQLLVSPEFWISILLSIVASFILLQQMFKTKSIDYNISSFSFLIFILAYMMANYNPLYAVVLINIYLFFLGVFIVKHGASTDNLGLLNYGLIIITALIICRFFDVKISFIIRGLLFLGVGAAFFLLNYRIIQKKKSI